MTSSNGNPVDRRTFVKQSVAAGVGLGLMGGPKPSFAARAPSDTLTVAVMGVNSRGDYLARAFAASGGASVGYVCDVDSRVMEKTTEAVAGLQDKRPDMAGDFRRALDDPNVDALVIAAPDHWHAPATLMALQAGKHVYLEKPCGHNASEGEMLVEAQRKYGKIVQMGNQQRSSPRSQEVIQEIKGGIIGRPYYAKAWYANTRGPIGRGSVTEPPPWLDYELWQGPAPRMPYRDNLIHYNWHWFWNWGTAEICNNGTHEIDVCRWALGVEFPARVTSSGGRYHYRDDDWRDMPDTQVASFEFEDGKTIVWEGKSCNGRLVEGRGRGVCIHGETGSVVIDRAGYVVYDQNNREAFVSIQRGAEGTLDTRGGGDLTDLHIENFLASVRGEATPNAPIDEGHKSQLLCHLGNIAWRESRDLACDPSNGHIDGPATDLWTREYESGWEPTV
jgi:predicted dehydrogenase